MTQMDGDNTGGFDRAPETRLSDLKAVDGSSDVTEYVPNRLLAVDVKKYSSAGVKVKKWLGLSLEHLETVSDRDLIVVRTILSVPTGTKPLQQFVMTDSEIDDGLKLDVFDLLRHRVRHLCLT